VSTQAPVRSSRLGCSCGCLNGVDCITERRTEAPEIQFCPCSALGTDALQKWALRWHLAGHPDPIRGAA
jgi:hypothetical protein